VIEAALCVPPLFLLLAVMGLSGGGSLVHVALVIALAEWPHAARLVRAEALRVAASPHVLAARGLGAGPVRVARVHVLPLSLSPAIVLASFGLGQAVLYESALGLLGFGVPPPTASFGELLAQGFAQPRAWLIAPPTVAIALLVLGARLLGGAQPESDR
jgi:peptide/nickel transport system permease protein